MKLLNHSIVTSEILEFENLDQLYEQIQTLKAIAKIRKYPNIKSINDSFEN